MIFWLRALRAKIFFVTLCLRGSLFFLVLRVSVPLWWNPFFGYLENNHDTDGLLDAVVGAA